MTNSINFSFPNDRQLIGKWIAIQYIFFFFCRSKRTLDKASNTSSVQVTNDNYTRLFSYRRRKTPGMSNTTFLRIYENQCRQRAPAERRSPHLALCPCVSPYLGKTHIPVEDSNSSQTQKRAFESNANQFVACSRSWVMVTWGSPFVERRNDPPPPHIDPFPWTETPSCWTETPTCTVKSWW